MADIQPSAAPARSSKPRAKKQAFRLDMTPMVDLAFLLLTFFMLTTTFSKPNVMQLTVPTLPEPGDEPTFARHSDALTLILDKGSRVHYFFGLNDESTSPEVHTTGLGPDGLRRVLLEQRQRNKRTTVLIKNTAEANYRDMVNVLDELTITNQRRYALVDLNKPDRDLLQRQGL